MAFPSSMLFVCLQSALTYRLAKTQEEYRIGHLRVGMALLALIALVLSILPTRSKYCVCAGVVFQAKVDIFLKYSRCFTVFPVWFDKCVLLCVSLLAVHRLRLSIVFPVCSQVMCVNCVTWPPAGETAVLHPFTLNPNFHLLDSKATTYYFLFLNQIYICN